MQSIEVPEGIIHLAACLKHSPKKNKNEESYKKYKKKYVNIPKKKKLLEVYQHEVISLVDAENLINNIPFQVFFMLIYKFLLF